MARGGRMTNRTGMALAFAHDRTFWSNFKIQGQDSCSATNCTAGDSSNTAHYSSGEGVHHPFLLEALLTASIPAVQSYLRRGTAPGH